MSFNGNCYYTPIDSIIHIIKNKLLISDKLENRYITRISRSKCVEICYIKKRLFPSLTHRTTDEIYCSRIIN